jgi:hypothetical protein
MCMAVSSELYRFKSAVPVHIIFLMIAKKRMCTADLNLYNSELTACTLTNTVHLPPNEYCTLAVTGDIWLLGLSFSTCTVRLYC